MEIRIIIAGGGTGGHIFPALAIANALRIEKEEMKILFVGAEGRMEMEKVPQAGYKIKGLDIAGFNRSSLIKNFSLPWKLLKSFFQVRKIFRDFKPHAVVGVGGYSSFPVLKFAQVKGISSFIHEANSFAGKSNMLLGKNATQVFVATDGMEKFFPTDKIVITGNPVRPDIINFKSINPGDAKRFFGLDPQKKTVLIMGGSLGAKSINEAIAKGLEQLKINDLQIIWQTGKTDATRWKNSVVDEKSIWVNEFISDMPYAYAAADIVVSRAGAMSVAELCVVEKPVVFVPFPYAAEDHQTVNAMNLVNKNAALIVKDSEALENVIPTVIALAGNAQKQKELKENIGRLKIVNADKIIAQEILRNISAN